jgi:tripartite-type tricarboxylate transporter receptor subunit TctC
MKFFCRLVISSLLVASVVGSSAAFAQFHPTKPVRIISPFSAGSGPDAALRAIAHGLNAKWGQPVIVDNRPGGNGFIAIALFRQAQPDGYTLINADASHVSVYPHTFSKLPYDPVTDLEPVRALQQSNFFVAVARDSPYKSLDDIVRAAAAKAEGVTYGSWFVGSAGHLGGLKLQSLTKTKMLHVAYKDTAQLYTALANGEVDWAIGSLASAGALEKSGKLRFIAVASRKRLSAMPELVAAGESTLAPDFAVSGGTGLFAPKGTPHPIRDMIANDISEILASPDMVERYRSFGYADPRLQTDAYANQIQLEAADWKHVIQGAGLRINE